MDPGLQNCCCQCHFSQSKKNPAQYSYQRPAPVYNQQQNTNFCKCGSKKNGIKKNEKIFLVCCQDCVINGGVKDLIPPSCSCCACNKCPLCLIKRICKDAWDDYERQKAEERYPLFDGGQRLSYEQYPPGKSGGFGQDRRGRDGYVRDGRGREGYGHGRNRDERSIRQVGRYDSPDRRDDRRKGSRRHSNESQRREDGAGRGRRDKRGGKDDRGGRGDDSNDERGSRRKRDKSRRRDSEDRLDDRKGKGSKKAKQGKTKSGYDSDDEDDDRRKGKGSGKNKDKGGKIGKSKSRSGVIDDDNEVREQRGKGNRDRVGKGERGDGKRDGAKSGASGGTSRGKLYALERPGASGKRGPDGKPGTAGGVSGGLIADGSGPGGHPGNLAPRRKPGLGGQVGLDGKSRAGAGISSGLSPDVWGAGSRSRVGIGTLLPDQDELLPKGRMYRGRFEEIGPCDNMRLLLESSDLKRMARSPSVYQTPPCNPSVPSACPCCPKICPQPCISTPNYCCMPPCCR